MHILSVYILYMASSGIILLFNLSLSLSIHSALRIHIYDILFYLYSPQHLKIQYVCPLVVEFLYF